jgi:hypothetical protein
VFAELLHSNGCGADRSEFIVALLVAQQRAANTRSLKHNSIVACLSRFLRLKSSCIGQICHNWLSEIKLPGCKADDSLPISDEVKNGGAVQALYCKSSWREAQGLVLVFLTASFQMLSNSSFVIPLDASSKNFPHKRTIL